MQNNINTQCGCLWSMVASSMVAGYFAEHPDCVLNNTIDAITIVMRIVHEIASNNDRSEQRKLALLILTEPAVHVELRMRGLSSHDIDVLQRLVRSTLF